jgi:hypothetical protein
MQHDIGKILTRATTLVETLLQLDSAIESYELPKSQDSNRDNFETISGLQFGSPKKMCHLDVAFAVSCREYYMGEGGGFPRVRAVVSQVSPRLLVACSNTQRVQNEF